MQQVSDFISRAQSLINSPVLDKVVGKVNSNIPDIALPPDQLAARKTLEQLQKSVYLQAVGQLKGGGSRFTQNELQRTSDALSKLDHTNMSPSQYRQALTEVVNSAASGLVNLHKNAGVQPPDWLSSYQAPTPGPVKGGASPGFTPRWRSLP